jgi:putative SOS response-associated peptidase YedK
MCFHTKQKKDVTALENRFKARFEAPSDYVPDESEDYNGFTYPQTPVITQQAVDKIQLFHWGLLPDWTQDISFRKNTLNAKIETIHEKPSFRNYVQNRCLILVDGFYEWQWRDEKGKNKQKYLITTPDDGPFAFAGIWNAWTDRNTGTRLHTYSILTTEANALMSVIHNSKKRMPFVLRPEEEAAWLNGQTLDYQRNVDLVAMEV